MIKKYFQEYFSGINRGCRKIEAIAPMLLQKKMGPEGPIYC